MRQAPGVYPVVRVVPIVLSGISKSGRAPRSKKGVMVNDTLSDFVTRIRNGYMAGATEISVPSSKMTVAVAGVLVKKKYLEAAEKKAGQITIKLKYQGKVPAITGIERVSKPGSRIYSGVGDLPKVWGGLGVNIVSTPKGVVDGKEAKKLNAGGEILARVW